MLCQFSTTEVAEESMNHLICGGKTKKLIE